MSNEKRVRRVETSAKTKNNYIFFLRIKKLVQISKKSH